jgi:spore maturation protein CgeB
MKIFLIGVHFFSSFAWSIKRALQRRGCEVVEFDYRANPWAKIPLVRTLYYQSIMQKRLLHGARLSNPELIIICKGELIRSSTVEDLQRRHQVPIVNWFPDARLYSHEKVIKSIPFLDRLYTKNQEDVQRAKLLNWQKVKYLPHCADIELHSVEEQESDPRFQADISFVGSSYPYRDLILSQLTGFNLKVWGRGWKRSRLYQMKPESIVGAEARGFDQAKVFRQSVVNINTHHPDDFGSVNQRVFDICGSGGFQLVDYRKPIEEYFEIRGEIETFSSLGELKDKIHFYLNHRQEASEIGARARQKTMKHHTYDHRVESILAEVDSDSA